tara:strand:- start:597 stop:737 length:141 start_codon:yes stop_codon:yes gene_type:complete
MPKSLWFSLAVSDPRVWRVYAGGRARFLAKSVNDGFALAETHYGKR